MRKNVRFFSVLLLVLFSVLLVGCNRNKTDKRIGVIMDSLTNENLKVMADTFKSYGESLGYTVLVSDANAEAAKVVAAAEDYATMGIKILLFSAMAPETAKTAIEAAKKINSDIVGIISAMDVAEMDFIVSQSDFEAAKIVGAAAAKWINENVKEETAHVGLINMQGAENTPLGARYRGFKEGVNSLSTKTIVYYDGLLDTTAGRTGFEVMEDWLQGFPQINIIFGTADFVGLGSWEAIKASGKNTDNYAIYGVDGTPNAIAALLEKSSFRGTVDSGSSAVPRAMIDVVVKIVEEGVDPKKLSVNIPPLVIDASNAKDWKYDYSNVEVKVLN